MIGLERAHLNDGNNLLWILEAENGRVGLIGLTAR